MPDTLAVLWARVALQQAQREHEAGQLSDEALKAYVERLKQTQNG